MQLQRSVLPYGQAYGFIKIAAISSRSRCLPHYVKRNSINLRINNMMLLSIYTVGSMVNNMEFKFYFTIFWPNESQGKAWEGDSLYVANAESFRIFGRSRKLIIAYLPHNWYVQRSFSSAIWLLAVNGIRYGFGGMH